MAISRLTERAESRSSKCPNNCPKIRGLEDGVAKMPKVARAMGASGPPALTTAPVLFTPTAPRMRGRTLLMPSFAC